MVRRSSTETFQRLEGFRDAIMLHTGDLLDQRSLVDVLRETEPDEIYNLAAMSFVAASWTQPVLTAEFTGVGVTRILEAMREVRPEARFYQASSSEMFGKVLEVPQRETTPFYPRSPYGVAKALRPLHHGQLPRVVRPFRLLGNPFQPRRRAPRVGVRDPQGHPRGRRDQARAPGRARARQPRCRARLGLREGLRRGHVAHAPAGRARRLRDRDGRGAQRPRAGRGRVRARRHRPGQARPHRPAPSCAPPRSST